MSIIRWYNLVYRKILESTKNIETNKKNESTKLPNMKNSFSSRQGSGGLHF